MSCCVVFRKGGVRRGNVLSCCVKAKFCEVMFSKGTAMLSVAKHGSVMAVSRRAVPSNGLVSRGEVKQCQVKAM